MAKLSNKILEAHRLENMTHSLETFDDTWLKFTVTILFNEVEFERVSRQNLLLELGVCVVRLEQIRD